jgi:hypothetical protein
MESILDVADANPYKKGENGIISFRYPMSPQSAEHYRTIALKVG